MTQFGSLFIISAASGTGKTSLVRSVINKINSIVLSISYTTRSKRLTEKEGVDYFFVSRENFLAMQEAGELLESVELYGNYYGTSRTFVLDQLSSGKDLLLEVDWCGANKVKEQLLINWPKLKIVKIFIFPPSLEVLYNRLITRGEDSLTTIEQRLSLAKAEIRHYIDYDYLIINNDFDTAFADLVTVVNADKLTLFKQEVVCKDLIRSLTS